VNRESLMETEITLALPIRGTGARICIRDRSYNLIFDTDGCIRIRHSGRQRRFVSVLELDIQGDIDSMLEFNITDCMTRFRMTRKQFDV
jgi:hypothetical protein